MVASRWRLGHEPTTARGTTRGSNGNERQRHRDLENLTKRYGQTTVVKGISFSVRPGEILGYLVPTVLAKPPPS